MVRDLSLLLTGRNHDIILLIELVPRESIVQWTAALREERVVIGLGRSKDSQVDSTPVTGKKQSSGSVSNEKVDINVDALKCSLVHWATAKALHSPEPLRVATVGLVNVNCILLLCLIIAYLMILEWKVDNHQLIGT